MSRSVLAFDYSGTLSLAMASFGERPILAKALVDSGLAAFGVTVDRYWQDVVGATWADASVGLDTAAALFSRRIEAQPWYVGRASEAEPAVTALLTAYLMSAVILSQWAPVLRRALAQPDQTVVVATDHYAEATSAVVDQLRRLDLPAVPIADGRVGDGIRVANSSDLGHTKRSPGFWHALDRCLGADSAPSLILVDDFRGHEPTAAPGARAVVARRRQETLDAAETVFPHVDIIVFETDRTRPSTWPDCINAIMLQIDGAVNRIQQIGTV